MADIVRSFKREMKTESFDSEYEAMDVTEQLEEGEISDDEGAPPTADTEAAIFEAATGDGNSDASKRFTLIGDLSLAVPKDELKFLYSSLGIDQENERHYRFNTVHMRGTSKMKTKDIFDYFSGLEPSKVEWLGEGVCNVEWNEEILPARALLYLSVEIKNLEKRFKMESGLSDYASDSEVMTSDSVDACTLKFSIPPGRWRKGVPCDLTKEILMRYANKDDKKVLVGGDRQERRHRHGHSSKYGKKSRHKEAQVEEVVAPRNPWGALAQSWGRGEGVEQTRWPAPENLHRPDLRTSLNDILEDRFVDNYMLRAMGSRKILPHSPIFSSSSGSSSDEEDSRRRKLPRMYADQEEEKQKIKRIATQKGDLRERLNRRKMEAAPHRKGPQPPPPPAALLDLFDESGDDLSSDWAVENYRDLRRTVATREHVDTEEESGSDLELGADEPGELLQIEIDNDRYYDKKKSKRY